MRVGGVEIKYSELRTKGLGWSSVKSVSVSLQKPGRGVECEGGIELREGMEFVRGGQGGRKE